MDEIACLESLLVVSLEASLQRHPGEFSGRYSKVEQHPEASDCH